MSVNAITPTDRKKDIRMKIGVASTTALAVGCAFAHIAKKQGFSLSSSAIRKTPVKDWALFKLFDKNKANCKEIELEGREIIEMAGASVLGGLIGGLIFDDKKYIKSKFRESVNQMLGNVLVPVGFVWGISELYKKHKASILNKVPQIKETGNLSKYFNKALKAIPFYTATLVALTSGIFAGNRVSNYLNEKVFHKKTERNIKVSDFAPHVDDVSLAISLMAEQSKTASVIKRTVPLFLSVPGYQTGIHRD